MKSRVMFYASRFWWVLLLLVLLAGYWLLPISGQVVIMPAVGSRTRLWPQMHLDPPVPQPGQVATLRVTDTQPWPYVLLTMNGKSLHVEKWWANPGDTWTWEWVFVTPVEASLVLYHDCHTGCVERGRMVIGEGEGGVTPSLGVPTKLGLVMANPQRDWHGRRGWDVEVTYARLAEEEYWGIDDLAARVYQATAKGLRVLVRVDYDLGQSLPPADDYLALSEYLQYLQRLARDDRLQEVYGYFLGSGYNGLDSNSQSPEQPVTPEWYARLFNGYGDDVSHTNNAVQVIRAENPQVRVLVGPLRPWNTDQNGERRYTTDVPWLNYMNTLVAALDEGARVKAAAGIPLTAPDGFALHVPGRPEAAQLAGWDGAEEPRLDLQREEWGAAQAGFRIYQDWLAIINSYPTTHGLPVYVTSTNTFAPDEGIPPAQNYPQGWLTAALGEINQDPQVQALCWFLDYYPHTTQWDWFSLSQHPGRLIYATEEFDALLKP